MKIFFTYFSIFLLILSCQKNTVFTVAKKDKNLVSYVNPFIGTGGHGHTYPGATMPFGMMQLSPDTRLDGWDGCSGYHYSDEYIYGFSHTHLSGTGVSDYGDILLMPTNAINFNNGADTSTGSATGKKGYKAHFSHDNEIAEPGYYKVHLDSTNIIHTNPIVKTNGEPLAFSLNNCGFGVTSDNFSFLDQDSQSLSAKGDGGMRQQHHYAGLDYNGNIDTPPDTYEPDKIGQVSMEQLQQKRNIDIKKK